MPDADILMPGTPSQDIRSGGDAQRFGDRDKAGALMRPLVSEQDAKKVASSALRLWESKDKWVRRELAQWRVNVARRRGIANAKVVADGDDYTSWFPTDVSPDITPNDRKLATLNRRLVALMFTDPPAPTVEPPSGDAEDVESSEFSERVLLDLESESNLNTVTAARNAFNMGCDYASGFVHYFIDPMGGGRVPIEVDATPDMQTAEDAESDVSPLTGQPWIGPSSTRYVTPDGLLTDDASEAATRWVPGIKREVLTGRNVRPIPHTATDIWECHGAQIGLFLPWGVVKNLPLMDLEGEGDALDLDGVVEAESVTVEGPEGEATVTEIETEEDERPRIVGDLSEEDRNAILDYRPDDADDMVSADERRVLDDDFEGQTDERLCFVLRTYFEQCPDYPDGLHLITLANRFVVWRDKWIDEDRGQSTKRLIPITQYKQFTEGRSNFYGVGSSDILGPGHEIRAAQMIGWLDHLDKINNQKVFLPLSSAITPQQLQNPRASVLHVNPGGAPTYEQVPDWPRVSQEMYALQGDEMDTASGTNEEAVQQSSSGRQAYALISQVHAGLSEPRQGIERGYTRGCRIELSLARYGLTHTQQLKWQSEGGRYKVKAWRGSDLQATYDVKVKPGTLTMLSPAGKAAFAEHMYLNLQLLSPEEMKDVITTNLGPVVAFQDDPYELRIGGQIAEWAEGPPEDWQPPMPQVLGVDPATFQPILGPPPPDPVLSRLWQPVLSDMIPAVAQKRLDKLAELTASPRYLRWPEQWRAGVDQEYMRMQQALAPSPQLPGAPTEPTEPGAAEGEPLPPEPPSGGTKTNTPTQQALGAQQLMEGVPPGISGGG